MGTPFLTHTPLMPCSDSPAEAVSTVLSEMFTGLIPDDCESYSELGTLARLTLLDFPDTPEQLRPILSSWPIFKNYTPQCYSYMSQICNKGVHMLRTGQLELAVAVGTATGASAADVQKKQASYSGHCFNVGRVITAAPTGVCAPAVGDAGVDNRQTGVYCFLLEGTAPFGDFHIPSADSSIKVPVKLWHHPGMVSGGYETRVMEFHEYLTLMGQSVTSLLQCISSPNGGHGQGGGWPVSMVPTKGWVANQVFTPTLNSDKRIYMEFYTRVVFMGLKSVPEGQGCMPVQFGENSQGMLPEIIAGCHPYDLNDYFLRGIDAVVPPERYRDMQDIMNEAHPPMVDHAVIKRLADMWAPCAPLSSVNQDAAAMRLPGVKYMRVACMETPAIPELAAIFCKARHMVCTRANKINRSRPDSDGAFFVCDDSPTCTGSQWFIEVAVKPQIPTAIHSLRTALKELAFPGYIPMGDEGC